VRIVRTAKIAKSQKNNLEQLYEEISNHFGEDVGWFRLVEFLRLEFLSVSCIGHLIESLENHSIDISVCIWSGLCSRLVIDVREFVQTRFPVKVKVMVKDEMDIELNAVSPLAGIIANLTSRFGGNVSDLSMVSVTSNSVCFSYPPNNAVDLTANSNFGSENHPDQWLCYDFLDRRVEVRHDSIRSQFDLGRGASHPKS
jgi:hypothetical protein